MLILAGDIGGTKTLLEFSEYQNGQHTLLARQYYKSADFSRFSDVVNDFIQKQQQLISHYSGIDSACFAVAGPIKVLGENTTSQLTNLAWLLDAKQLSQQFDIKKTKLINDFQAVGYGVNVLDKSDFKQLQKGQAIEQATRLVIGAGTGLGVAQLIWYNSAYHVLATEGGHTDFAPRDDIQMALLKHIQLRCGHVTCEDVLSGPGLINIYHFLHEYRSGNPETLEAVLKEADSAAIIANRAEQGIDNLADETLTLFVEIYGAIVGNFALSSMALGGVYIAGGIAPKLIQRLEQRRFLTAFGDKGKMENLMSRIPVAVVMNPDVGLIGSRYIAKHQY